jgi:hypothetical protein
MFAPQVNKERKLKELDRYGLSLEDFSAEEIASWGIGDIEIWHENWRSFQLFNSMQTQWRVGMNGRTGLDYSALSELWRRLKIPVSERDDLFADLQHMEIAALTQMRENEEKSRKKQQQQAAKK